MDDRNKPATKDDVDQVAGRVDQIAERVDQVAGRVEQVAGRVEQITARVEQVAERVEQLRTEMNHQYNDLVERIADGQTELLKAFYSYAQGNNKRVAEVEGNEGAFRSRLATMEDRILEVERRLNIPPTAA